MSPAHHRLFWTDWQIGSIHTHDLITNETRQLIDTPDTPIVIHVWDERLQPSGDNPCKHKNGNCSHLCLLSNSTAGFSCMIQFSHCISISISIYISAETNKMISFNQQVHVQRVLN